MKFLLQPASGKEPMEHFDYTIANGVIVTALEEYLSAIELQPIVRLNENYVKVWGIVPTRENKPRKQWTDLQTDDAVLFYAKKHFYYFARVLTKMHNNKLAGDLWGVDKQGRTWEYIYFIKEGKQIQVPYDPTILGYDENHIVQGAMLLSKTQSQAMEKYLEQYEGELFDEEAIQPSVKEEHDFNKRTRMLRTPEEAQKEIISIAASLANKPVNEKIKTAKILSRNPTFARLVKERAKYVCEVCGAEPFIQKSGIPYAEAHHIYELSKSRIDDPNFMFCACPTCHKVIHYGNDESLEKRKELKRHERTLV